MCLLCLLFSVQRSAFSFQPSQSLTASPSAGTETPPEPKAAPGQSVIEIEADWVKSDDEKKVTEASGQVVARYKDSTVSGENMRVDHKTYTAVVEGPFLLEEKDSQGNVQTLRGEELQYNFKSRLALFKKGHIVQDAEGPGQHLYIEADEALSRNRRRLLLKGADITTCDFVEKKLSPHYHITASAGLIVPGDKIILRDMTLYNGSTPVFWAPMWMISLKKRQYLSIGNTLTEGWFVKTALAYSLKGNDVEDLYQDFQDIYNMSLEGKDKGGDFKTYPDDYGVVYNDFMQIKGWGKGIEHTHEFGPDTQFTGAYYQLGELDTGLNDYSWKMDLKQKISNELRYTAKWEDRNIYNLAGGRDDLGKAYYTVSYSTPTTSVNLASNDDYVRGFFPSNTTSNMLTLTENISPQWQLTSSVNHTSFIFGSTGSFDQFMTHQSTLNYRENWGSVSLMNKQFQDLTPDAAARFSNRAYTDITPELAVQYNLAKVLDQSFTLKGTAGYYFEKIVNPNPALQVMKTNRYTTDITAINRPIYPFNDKNFFVDMGGSGYTQYFYDTGDQQYVLRERLSSTWTLSPISSLTSTYAQDHLNAENNTPFRTFDFLTQTHLLMESFRMDDKKNYDWTTSTGFNYLLDQYLPLASNLNYYPSQKERYNLAFGYDINTHIYQPLTLQATLQSREGAINNSMGADSMAPQWSNRHYFNYNLNLGRLDSMTNALEYDYGHSWEDHWVVSLAGSYSFFAAKYDMTLVSITKDLHDIMISFSYSPLSQSYLLTIASIAFPSSQGQLGLSQGRYSVGVPGQQFQF